MKQIKKLIAVFLILILALSGCRTKSGSNEEPMTTEDSGSMSYTSGSDKTAAHGTGKTPGSSSGKTKDTAEESSSSGMTKDSGDSSAAEGPGSTSAYGSDVAGEAALPAESGSIKASESVDTMTGASDMVSSGSDILMEAEGGDGSSDGASARVFSGSEGLGSIAADSAALKDSTVALSESKTGILERYESTKSDGGLSGSEPFDIMPVGGDTFFDEDAPGDDIDIWDTDDPFDPFEPVEPIEEPIFIKPAAGLLTAGEWNDNRHFDFLKNLIENGQNQDYSSFFRSWELTPFSRLIVHVSAGDETIVSAQTDDIETVTGQTIGTRNLSASTNVENAVVTVFSPEGNIIWRSKTDNKGMTYVFYRLYNEDAVPARVTVLAPGCAEISREVTSSDLLDENVMEIVVSDAPYQQKKLDLMFVIDTTGSMGDEISYLQKELENVIERVQKDNANLPVRLSVNFYRDIRDEYVVRSNPFTYDINSQLIKLNAEHADGGGDYEEAVEQALEDAINAHDWNGDSVKLMFMVLDAPPHNTSSIKQQLASTLSDAIEKGIRIIPVASSGVDKSTEFLLRTFAMSTGGTYTFLTDDSGIGGSHIEPTIGDYDVENLNDLLVRIIGEYLSY